MATAVPPRGGPFRHSSQATLAFLIHPWWRQPPFLTKSSLCPAAPQHMGDCAHSSPRPRRGSGVPSDHSPLRRALISTFTPLGFSRLTCLLLLLDVSTWRNKLSWASRFQLADLLGQGKDSRRHGEGFQADVTHRRNRPGK